MQAAQFRCEAAIVGGCEAKLKLLFTSQLGVKGLRADESDTEHDSETGTGCRNDSAVRESSTEVSNAARHTQVMEAPGEQQQPGGEHKGKRRGSWGIPAE